MNAIALPIASHTSKRMASFIYKHMKKFEQIVDDWNQRRQENSDIPNLNGADFEDVLFNNINFSDVQLQGANFRNAQLENANFSNANLSNADFSNANLSNANLNNANCSNANLSNTQLGNASLNYTNLRGGNFSGVNFSNAQISDSTILDDKWRLVVEIFNRQAKGMDLSDVDLSNANLSKISLIGANLQNANLSMADLSMADLSNANLNCANLSKANLWNTNLSSTNLAYANVNDATMNYCNLADADLNNVKNLTLEQAQQAQNWLKAKYDLENTEDAVVKVVQKVFETRFQLGLISEERFFNEIFKFSISPSFSPKIEIAMGEIVERNNSISFGLKYRGEVEYRLAEHRFWVVDDLVKKINSGTAAYIIELINKISISLKVDACSGCDGTSYTLKLNRGFHKIKLNWWCNLPESWKQVQFFQNEIIRLVNQEFKTPLLHLSFHL